jgi:nickel/cobalt transporter (NicO) family protein
MRSRARLRGAGHVHSHSHPHESSHDRPDADHEPHGPRRRSLSRRELLALAVSGGILPSPTALVVLTGSIAAHRVAYGLSLIAAFSLGLATALVGIGLVSLRARSIVSRRLSGSLAGWMPIASAALIMVFGLAFTARAALQVI